MVPRDPLEDLERNALIAAHEQAKRAHRSAKAVVRAAKLAERDASDVRGAAAARVRDWYAAHDPGNT